MHTPSSSAYADHASSTALPQPHHAEVVYRGLTLAAMLLLLATLWVF